MWPLFQLADQVSCQLLLVWQKNAVFPRNYSFVSIKDAETVYRRDFFIENRVPKWHVALS